MVKACVMQHKFYGGAMWQQDTFEIKEAVANVQQSYTIYTFLAIREMCINILPQWRQYFRQETEEPE